MKALLAVAACAVVMALVAGATPARADFGVALFDGGTFGPPPEGTTDAFVSGPAYTQAGGHPYEAWTAFEMNRVIRSDGASRSDGGNFRNVRIDLPPGLVGNPTAVPQCTRDRRMPISTDDVEGSPPSELCPVDSVVGLALITFGSSTGGSQHLPSVVFNLEPPPGVAASFGFTFQGGRMGSTP
jgi:hypothetical protein